MWFSPVKLFVQLKGPASAGPSLWYLLNQIRFFSSDSEGIREDDILGISAEGDTLLVNLSENFREAILENGADNEMLLCYSMVNTLCKNTGMKRVRFYFEGRQEEHIAGTIYWAGEFMYNIGLAEKGLG